MAKKNIYQVRFITENEGIESLLVAAEPAEIEALKETLNTYAAAGEVHEIDIILVDERVSVSPEQLKRNLEGRFGALKKGLPDESRVDERFAPKTESIVRDLLVTAFEGGSNYWYRIEKEKFPPGTKKADFVEGGRMQPEGNYYHWSQLIPTIPGGHLVIRDVSEGQGETFVLDLPALKRAWVLLREKFPKRYKRILDEDFDAADGDAFLQLATFGDVIYG